MFKKILGSLVVLSLVIGGGTVLQVMGDEHVKREDKTKDIKVVKNKERSSSQKSIQYSRSAPKKVAKLKGIENWEIYTSDIGSYEIKYPSQWKVEKEYPKYLEAVKEEIKAEEIWLVYPLYPFDISSINKALETKKGFVSVSIEYTNDITMAYYHIEEILEEEKKKFPKKFLSFGILEVSKDVEKDQIFFASCLKTDKGYYLIHARVYDPFNEGYEGLVKQVLSTFKIRGAK